MGFLVVGLGFNFGGLGSIVSCSGVQSICCLTRAQLVEPMVLVPCVRFGCKAMILAGDINQLPPTLPGRTDADSGCKHPMDLSKTLFQRLSFRGLQPIFLNIQYVMLTQVPFTPAVCLVEKCNSWPQIQAAPVYKPRAKLCVLL